MPAIVEPDTIVHVCDEWDFDEMVAPVSAVTMVGKQIPHCKVCRHLHCVCSIIKSHTEKCTYRMAATCAVPMTCDEHGLEVCPTCDACDCKT